MAGMLRTLVDRPLADAVAEGRPGGPAWIVPPGDPHGGCAWFDRIVLLVPLFFPVSAAGETFFGDCRAYGPGQHAWLQSPEGLDLVRRSLADAPAATGAFALGGSDNHFHWIADFLPRLALLAAAPGLGERPALVHDGLDDGQRAAIGFVTSALGMPTPPLAPVAPGALLLRDAAVPTRIDRLAAVAFWGAVLDRAGIARSRRRRLVVRRSLARYRRVADEDELVERLARHGFEPVEPATMTLEAQARIFAEAAVILGAHGAGLANLLFAPPGAAVIELRIRRHTGEYAKLSRLAALGYAPVEVAAPDPVGPNPLKWDLRIDAAAMARIEALVAGLD